MKASIKENILFVLGSLFLLILLGLLIFDLARRGVYNNKMGINILIIGDREVSVALLRPDEKMLGFFRLPDNIRVKVYNSEAHYPLESLWSYGVSEKKPYEITQRSLGQAMGVVLSRTVRIDGSPTLENILGRLLQINLKTDLSLRDRISIRTFLADAVNSKKMLELTVPGSVFDDVVDPDGKSFKEFNQTMNLWTKNKFVIEPILNENVDISINNVSGISGLGNILSNQLESTGMHVVEVKADTEEIIPGKACVYSSENKHEMTEQLLREQVGCQKIAVPNFVEDGDTRLRIWVKAN